MRFFGAGRIGAQFFMIFKNNDFLVWCVDVFIFLKIVCFWCAGVFCVASWLGLARLFIVCCEALFCVVWAFCVWRDMFVCWYKIKRFKGILKALAGRKNTALYMYEKQTKRGRKKRKMENKKRRFLKIKTAGAKIFNS